MISEAVQFFRRISKPMGRAYWWPGKSRDKLDAAGVLLVSYGEIDDKTRARLLQRYAHYRRQPLLDDSRPSDPAPDTPDSWLNIFYRLGVFATRTVVFVKTLAQGRLSWSVHLCECESLARAQRAIMLSRPYQHVGDLRGHRWRDLRRLERLAHALDHRRYEVWFVFRDRREAFVPPSLDFPGEPLKIAELEELARHRGLPSAHGSGMKRLTPEAGVLRVMTYNVHACFGLDGRLSVRRIAEVIERYDPHVVAIQELDRNCKRSDFRDQLQELSQLWPSEACFFPTMARGKGGEYGIGYLSRLQVESWQGKLLPGGRGAVPTEPRAALLAQLRLAPGRSIHLLNVHLGLTKPERMVQIGGLEAILDELPEPVILMGDFNCRHNGPEIKRLRRRLRPTSDKPLKTWFGSNPIRTLDYAMSSGSLRTQRIFVPIDSLTRVASDHLPLIVDFVVEGLPSGVAIGDPVRST